MSGGMFDTNSRFMKHVKQFAGAAQEPKGTGEGAREIQEALKASSGGGPIAEQAEKGVG